MWQEYENCCLDEIGESCRCLSVSLFLRWCRRWHGVCVYTVHTHTRSTLEVEMQPVKVTVHNSYFNWRYVSVWSFQVDRRACCGRFYYIYTQKRNLMTSFMTMYESELGQLWECYQGLFKPYLHSSLCSMAAVSNVALIGCCPRLYGHTWLGIAKVYCSIFVNNLMTVYMHFFFLPNLSGWV